MEDNKHLGGGDNTQEFLFKYKPGKLRTSEPTYTYSHDFGLTSSHNVQMRSYMYEQRIVQMSLEDVCYLLKKYNLICTNHYNVHYVKVVKIYARRADKIVVDDNMKHLAAIQSRIEEILAVNPASPAFKKNYTRTDEKVKRKIADHVSGVMSMTVAYDIAKKLKLQDAIDSSDRKNGRGFALDSLSYPIWDKVQNN